MAMVDPDGSPCAICDERLAGSPFGATSGVAFPRDHALWRFCDAPFHFDCMERWPHRREFAAGYFEISREGFKAQGTLLREAPTWLLGCGMMSGRVTYVEAVMREWPVRFNKERERWAEYMGGDFATRLRGEALAAAKRIAPEMIAASVELGLVSPGRV
jgi:hypothetical protein